MRVRGLAYDKEDFLLNWCVGKNRTRNINFVRPKDLTQKCKDPNHWGFP